MEWHIDGVMTGESEKGDLEKRGEERQGNGASEQVKTRKLWSGVKKII